VLIKKKVSLEPYTVKYNQAMKVRKEEMLAKGLGLSVQDCGYCA